MKKVGFITSPLSSGHAVRGVGFYTSRLLQALKTQCSKFNIQLVEINNLLDIGHWTLDIIHYPYFDPFSPTLPIVKKTKTIVTVHDVIPLEFPDHYPPGIRGWVNLQLQKLSLINTDRIITDSFYSLKKINKYLGVPPHKLRLVYLAADPIFKKIPHPVNKYNLPKKFALYVGDVNYNKNIPLLVQACRKLNLPLVIVGKQAQEIEKLNLSHPELSHLRDIDWSGITHLGFVDDLVDIYNLASVYCQPSLSEGFGLPVLEAQACGTPVACSRAGSLPEIASDTAVYFDPYNIDDMAQAITTAMKRKRIIVNNFSWKKTAEQTLQVYQELL
ncbi:MAG: Mannosyltransferase B-like protein [Microgenomates group bacterium Gr01-1014_16]|nr:MAG: Mannosyltransferase B-like protein [Microgenomates group bacterium Gr01-1014_16]